MKFVIFLVFIFLQTTEFTLAQKIKLRKSQNNDTSTKTNLFSSDTKPFDQFEFYSEDYYEMFSSRFFETNFDKKCSNKRCFPPYGKCIDNTCKCIKGYVNENQKVKSNYCSYKIKSQFIAFLLEIFTLIGGDIYLEHYSYAIFKGVFLLIMISIFIMQLPCKFCGVRDFIDYTCLPCVCIKTGTFVICTFGIITWEIADLIRIMSYKLVDSHSMPLDYFF